MKSVFYIVSALVVATMIAGCCACRKGKNSVELVGTEWHLVRMMERDLDIEPEQFIFTFGKDGNFGGIGACNRMMGEYSVTEKGAMSFGAVASTRMLCPESELESRFAQILE